LKQREQLHGAVNNAHSQINAEVAGTSVELYRLYYNDRTPIPTSLYEPNDGVYLGADISRDRIVGGIYENYESLMGMEAVIYVKHISIYSRISADELLRYMIDGKAPLFIVELNTGDPMLPFVLDMFSREFGVFDIPIFMEIVCSEPHIWRIAYHCFNQNAPNVALIYNTAKSGVRNYPGDRYIDWISTNMYFNNTNEYEYDRIYAEFEEFYLTFHHRKPLMITFGVPTVDSSFTYTVGEALSVIDRFYTELTNYPRVKAVIYANHGDYSLTNYKESISEYRNIVANRFLSNIIERNRNEPSQQFLLSREFVTKHLDFYAGTVNYHIPTTAVSVLSHNRNIPATVSDGILSYNVFSEDFLSLFDVRIDYERKALYIQNALSTTLSTVNP
jgi:hypothetical protein